MRYAILVVAMLTASAASAQTQYYYGADGSYQGSSNRIGNQTYYYGGNGSYQGNSQTTGNNTYYYGGNGAYQGYRNGGIR